MKNLNLTALNYDLGIMKHEWRIHKSDILKSDIRHQNQTSKIIHHTSKYGQYHP